MNFRRTALVSAFVLSACTGRPVPRSHSSSAPPTSMATPPTRPDSTLTAAQDDFLSVVTPGDIAPTVASACDTLVAVVHRVLGLGVRRQDGSFTDSFQSTPRIGCRLITIDTLTPPRDTVTISDAIPRALAPLGWARDLRYDADGPGSSDIGVRRRDVVCIIMERGDGPDDDEAPTVAAPAPSTTTLIIECVRDVAPNTDVGVPDSLWRIARDAGIDSLYAIDMRLQYPPYLDGDFDGDGVTDAAVLVQQRTTGKLGVAFVLRGPGKVVVFGAGTPDPSGADDLSWIDRWDRISKGTTYDLTHRLRLAPPPRVDVVWVAHGDSTGAYIAWTGTGFALRR
jgi:hypothetical protein